MAKNLTKTHCTALQKVYSQLRLNQTMNYTQIIMGEENRKKFKDAEKLIYEAISILQQVK